MVIGENSFGQKLADIIPGFSMGNISRTKFESSRYEHLTSPFTKAINKEVADNYYKNTLKLLGYEDDAAQKHMESDGFGNRMINWGLKALASTQIGEGSSQYFNSALRRRFAYDETDAYKYMRNFSASANDIMQIAAKNGFNSLTANEALKLGGQLIASGRYDDADYFDTVFKDDKGVEVKKNRISEDIKKYAKGVRDLGDALKGGLDELFESFKKLTGNAVTSTSYGRFNTIARSLGDAIMYGNVSEQLVQQAAQTYQAANQGVSTQALSGVQAIQAETVTANRGLVENSTEQGVRSIMFNQHRSDMASGRLRNISAAYTHFLRGGEATDENWRKFVENLGGEVTDAAISQYIADNNLSASFLNSTLVNNNMADTNIVNSGFRNRRKDLEQAWKNTIENDKSLQAMGLTSDDLYLDAEALYKKIQKINPENATAIYGQVEQMRDSLLSTYIDNTADSRDILSTIKGDQRAENLAKQAEMGHYLFDSINGKSVEGFAGVLNAMSKKWGKNDAKVATLVQGFFGMETSGNLSDEFKARLKEGTLTEGDLEKYGITQEKLDYINSLSHEERRLLIGSAYLDDADVEVEVPVVGKDGKPVVDKDGKPTTKTETRKYGDIRRNLMRLSQKAASNEALTPEELKEMERSFDAMAEMDVISKKQAKEYKYRMSHGISIQDEIPDLVIEAGMKADELASKYSLGTEAAKKLHQTVASTASENLTAEQFDKRKNDVIMHLVDAKIGKDKVSRENLSKENGGFEENSAEAKAFKQIKADVDKMFGSFDDNEIERFLNKILDGIKDVISAINNNKNT